MENEVLLEKRGQVLWVVLNRPAAFNALTPSMIGGLEDALDQMERGTEVRALAITGNGKAFCAGADLKAILAQSGRSDANEALNVFVARVSRAFNRLEAARVPTVAALNGITMAGGLELALCCDFIVAEATAKIGDGHANYAQIPGAGSHFRLPRRVGVPLAKRLLFSAELWGAEEAQRRGLIDEVAEPQRLACQVEALLAPMLEKSPLVLSRMKTLVMEGQDQDLALALASERRMVEWHAGSVDRNEGLAAFAEKRKPRYVGC